MRAAGLLIALTAFAAGANAADVAAPVTTPCPPLPQPSVTPCPPLPQPTTVTPCPPLPQPTTVTPCPPLPQPTTTAPPVPTTTAPPVPTTTAPPVPGNCTIVENKDRAGFDLSNVKAPLADCQKACDGTKGCVTYAWNNYNGGTCWLKSKAAALTDKAGVWSTTCVKDAPTPPAPTCNAYTDIDFVGNDIANKPAKAAGECCDVCNKYAGCTAYAWSNHEGGTCWLKSSVGHVIAKAGVISSSTVKLWGPVCPFEYDVDFIGNDVGNKPASDAGKCCDLCKATPACKAYTWSNYKSGTCWMKSGKGKTVYAKGLISANIVDGASKTFGFEL